MPRRPVVRTALAVALMLVIVTAINVFSQGSAVLSGLVKDDKGQALHGVLVSAKSGAKTVTVVSKFDGRFTLTDLTPGAYDVKAVREGYKTASQRTTLPAAASVQFTLTPGSFDRARLSWADLEKALPDSPHKKVLLECQICHSWNGVATQRPHRTADWVNGMRQMVNVGWGKFDEVAIPQMAEYLQANFGPDTKLDVKLTPEPIDERGLNIKYMAFDIPSYHAMPHTAYPDGQGSVWFTEYGANKIGRLDPKTGQMEEFPIPGSVRPSPHGIVRDKKGIVWFTAQTAGKIGRFDPATKTFKEFTVPPLKNKSASKQVVQTEVANMRREVAPHTPVVDNNGHVWFTAVDNPLWELNPETGVFKEHVIRPGNGALYGVTVDPKTNRVWYAGLGLSEVGYVDPTTGKVTRFAMLTPDAGPRRLHLDSKGVAWCNLYNVNKIARIDPATGKVTEWDLPGGRDGLPYAFGVDHQDRVWTTTYKDDRLHMFDPKTERVTSYVMPTKGNGMRDFYPDENGWIWAAAWGHNQVVAFRLEGSPR